MFLATSIDAFVLTSLPQGVVASETTLTEEPWILILVILALPLNPLANNIDLNEIQLHFIVITALGVGFIIPRFGLNSLVVSSITFIRGVGYCSRNHLQNSSPRYSIHSLHARRCAFDCLYPCYLDKLAA